MTVTEKRDGITIVDQHVKLGHTRCKHWLFRCWSATEHTWKSKAFDEKAKGWEWAEDLRARLTLGIEQAKAADLLAIGKSYVEAQNDRDLREEYVGDIEDAIARCYKAGCKNVLAPDFPDRVRRWRATMTSIAKGREKPLSASTKNRIFKEVKQAITYAVKRRWIPYNPLAAVGPIETEKSIAPTFTVSELKHLVADEHRAERIWLAAVIMTYTGFRCQEALHLRWEWIDWSGKTIHLHNHADFRIKRRKERIIPVQAELAAILTDLPTRELHGWVITDKKLRGYYGKEFWLLFREYCTTCGFEPGKRKPHSFRHSWVSLLLATGESVTRVKRWAGHEEIKTTDGYADAETSYSASVKGWPSGQFYLRRPSPAAADAEASATKAPAAIIPLPERSIAFER